MGVRVRIRVRVGVGVERGGRALKQSLRRGQRPVLCVGGLVSGRGLG